MKEQFGLKDLPGVAVANMKTNKNFVFSEEFNAGNLKAFLTKYSTGELKATIKSAENPTGDKKLEDGVTVVVGTSFKEDVMD